MPEMGRFLPPDIGRPASAWLRNPQLIDSFASIDLAGKHARDVNFDACRGKVMFSRPTAVDV
jgi:hypothetical protein